MDLQWTGSGYESGSILLQKGAPVLLDMHRSKLYLDCSHARQALCARIRYQTEGNRKQQTESINRKHKPDTLVYYTSCTLSTKVRQCAGKVPERIVVFARIPSPNNRFEGQKKKKVSFGAITLKCAVIVAHLVPNR